VQNPGLTEVDGCLLSVPPHLRNAGCVVVVHGIDNDLPSPISISELDEAGVDSKDSPYRCSVPRLLGELHISPYESDGRSNLAAKWLARLLLVRSVVGDP
jgi:hypothetical protein